MINDIQPNEPVAKQSFLVLDDSKINTKWTNKSAPVFGISEPVGIPAAATIDLQQFQSHKYEELRLTSTDGTYSSGAVPYCGDANVSQERQPAVVLYGSRVTVSPTTTVEPSPMLSVSMPTIPLH